MAQVARKDFAQVVRAVAAQQPGSRAMTRVRVGPDHITVVIRDVTRMTALAANHNLLTSCLVDPEATNDQYQMLVLLNGARDDMIAFAEAMAASAR